MRADTAPLPPSPLEQWPPRWAPEAVVFDCDGLLIDTEARWVQLQDAYLARQGVTLPPATRRSLTGASGQAVSIVLAEHLGRDPYEVGEELMAEAMADTGHTPQPLPGALETLRAVAARRPVAVASNSPREMLDAKLTGLGIAGLLGASIAVEDVAEPKPAPDMYLVAARALGAEPTQTLGFEDSEAGARAARSAGLQLIAVPSVPGQEPAAPRTLASLADPALRTWIESWEPRR